MREVIKNEEPGQLIEVTGPTDRGHSARCRVPRSQLGYGRSGTEPPWWSLPAGIEPGCGFENSPRVGNWSHMRPILLENSALVGFEFLRLILLENSTRVGI